MKVIDRYITRQFLLNFVILTFVFMLLFVLVDFIFDIDEFLEGGEVRAQRLAGQVIDGDPTAVAPTPSTWYFILGTIWTIGDFYGPMVTLLFVFLTGLLVTAAMGFTLAGMTRNGEVSALLASGVSMYRLAAPIFVTGCLLNLLTLPVQEWVIPRMADKLIRSKNDAKYDRVESYDLKYLRDKKGNLLSASHFDPGRRQLTRITILKRDENGSLLARIVADSADWVSGPQQEGWSLVNGYQQTLRADADAPQTIDQNDPTPLEFYETDLSPNALLARRAAIYSRLLSTRHLRALRDDPMVPANQILHSRISILVVNVLVLVMGLPFFLLREPASMLAQTIKASGICLGAWSGALLVLNMDLSHNILPPASAAWMPVVVYLPGSAFLMQFVKT